MTSGPASGSSGTSVTKVVGRYTIFGELASGGMATVHLGRLNGPSGFSRTVAIKRLHPQHAKDPDFVTMFMDEARLAARVQHPNVVPTLDVVSDGGELFVVMEYIEGETLSMLLRTLGSSKRRIPVRIAAHIVSDALHGLHGAHEAKNERGAPLDLIHRDVSPQNILVGTDGVARVLDFGVAKATGRLQTTEEGKIKGKLAYMAPEQLSGEPVSRRVDVFAAGIVLWEALTGQRLFQGNEPAETVMKVLEAKVAPPSSFVPDVPEALDAIVLRALHRDPARRFPTARDVALEIERVTGLVPAREVGQWVAATAGERLSDRARRVAEISSSSPDETAVLAGTRVARQPARVASSMTTGPTPTSLATSGPAPSSPAPVSGAARATTRARGGGRVKGASIRAVMEWYVSRFGPQSVGPIVQTLSPELRALLREDQEGLGIMSASWYPDQLLHAFCDTLTEKLTPVQRVALAKSGAYASTTSSINGVYRAIFRSFASPSLYARYSQRLWAMYYDNGLYSVKEVSETEHEIHIGDWLSHHPVNCESILGSSAAIYELLGCQGIGVTRLGCVEEGAPDCSFKVIFRRA